MFLDTMESGAKKKKLSSVDKTVLIIWAQICGEIALIGRKMTSKYFFLSNLDLKGINFCVTRFATQFIHVS